MIHLALLLLLTQQPKTAPAQAPSTQPQAKHETVLSTQSLDFMAKRLVGIWEQPSDERDMGVMLTLAPEGVATLSTGIVEDLNYNFDGKQLIVVDAEDPEDVKQISTIVLNGDTMKETNNDSGQSAEFVRVTQDLSGGLAIKKEPNSLVGVWKRDVAHLPRR